MNPRLALVAAVLSGAAGVGALYAHLERRPAPDQPRQTVDAPADPAPRMANARATNESAPKLKPEPEPIQEAAAPPPAPSLAATPPALPSLIYLSPSLSAPAPQGQSDTRLAYAPNPPLADAPVSNIAPDHPAPPLRPSGLGTPLASAPAAGAAGDFKKGSAAFVRIFKKEGQLELWLKKDGKFALFKTYPVCKWSGVLGPKLKQADYQSPEGFYSVSAKQLKPDSAYHRAFNIGYPNAFDKQLNRTGGLIMVHGDCKSVGCFAMTNKGVAEIYSYVEAALRGGQREMPVHVFPFRMSEAAIAREAPNGFASLFSASPNASWADFWRNLKEGADLFEKTGEPPVAYACNGKYAFNAAGAGCVRIAGW